MPTRDEHIAALKRAVDAGDTGAANEIAAYLDTNMPSAQALQQQDFESMPGMEQALIGAGENVEELLQGIGFGTTSEEDLRRSQQVDSPYKTGGKIAADVGMLAMPAAKLAKGAGLTRALAREAALVGGYEGAKLPDVGDSRLGNAATGAALTAVGGSVLPLAMRGVKAGGRGILNQVAPIDPAAREMLDQGVKLTPGMARPNLAGVERMMGRIPGMGGKVEDLQRQSIESWNRYIMDQVSPVADDIGVSGTKGFQELQNRFTDAYQQLWGKVTPDSFSANKLYDDLGSFSSKVDTLPGEYTNMAKSALEDAQQAVVRFSETGNTAILDNLDDTLRDYAFKGGKEAGDYFNDLRKVYRKALPKDVGKKLKEVDSAYRKYAVAQRAGSYVDTLTNEGIFSPRSLLGAVKAKNSERALVSGRGALQPEAQRAGQVLGRTIPSKLNPEEPAADLATQAATAAAVFTNPVPTIGALTGGRGLVNQSMRDVLTGGSLAPMRFQPVPGLATSQLTPEERQKQLAEAMRRSFR